MLKGGGDVEEEGLAAEGVGCADAAGISYTDCVGFAGSIKGYGTGGADCSIGCADGSDCADGPVSVAGCAVSDGGKLKPVLNK